MKVPECTDLVKLAKFKELAPYDKDWYFIRAGTYFVIYVIHFHWKHLFKQQYNAVESLAIQNIFRY